MQVHPCSRENESWTCSKDSTSQSKVFRAIREGFKGLSGNISTSTGASAARQNAPDQSLGPPFAWAEESQSCPIGKTPDSFFTLLTWPPLFFQCLSYLTPLIFTVFILPAIYIIFQVWPNLAYFLPQKNLVRAYVKYFYFFSVTTNEPTYYVLIIVEPLFLQMTICEEGCVDNCRCHVCRWNWAHMRWFASTCVIGKLGNHPQGIIEWWVISQISCWKKCLSNHGFS